MIKECIGQKSVCVSKFKSIQYVRVLAMVLILWDHLVPGAYYGIGVQPTPSIIEKYIIWPLAITNYFGALGVDLFFLITGFLTVLYLTNTGVISFLIKRTFRLGPAIAFGYVLYYLLLYLSKILGFDVKIDFSAYWTIGPLWYIRVLVCYYIIFSCCIPLFKKSLFGGLLIFQIVLITICSLSKQILLPFDLGNTCSYIFYITIGMSVHNLLINKSSFLAFLFQFSISWFGIIYYNINIFNPERAETGNSFGVSAMYALLLFLVFILAEDLLPNSKIVKKISDYSYGIYVHHMPIFSIVLSLLTHFDTKGIKMAPQLSGGAIKVVCYTTITVSMILTIGASYIQNKWIDTPCVKMSKILIGRLNNGQI
ncbi:acyltransferase [Butyricicoccus faecihominis]|nr:acyltransferase [Butyricicoccus faecihominis]